MKKPTTYAGLTWSHYRTRSDGKEVQQAEVKYSNGLRAHVLRLPDDSAIDLEVYRGRDKVRSAYNATPEVVTEVLTETKAEPKPAPQPRLRRVRPDVYDQWANQTMDWSRNAQGNKKHDGKVAKSYGMTIGIITSDVSGRDVYLIVPGACSTSTTNRHIYECVRAVPHGETVHRVPNIEGARYSNALDHEKNARWLVQQAKDELGKAKRARAYGLYHLDAAESFMAQARDYCASFGLALVYPVELTSDAMDQLRPDLVAKRDRHESRQAERDAAREARWRRQDELRAERQAEYDRVQAERRAQAEVRLADDLARWQDGGPHAYSFSLLTETRDDRLRLSRNGQEVQTTRQCNVPVQAVRETLPMVLRAIANGATWAGSVRLGAYDLRAITHEHVMVGCHTFRHAEIQRFAQALADHDRAVSDAQVEVPA